ncbi:MAG: DEAD/DEAH box helicase family protein, partial [Rhodanobacter sp.]
SDFTQSVNDAVDQYRFDRHPQPKGGVAEPILGFPGGALVHFAVSQAEVMMTTRLAGPATRFLPFNRGNHGAAGNVPNAGGFATAYLWEEVWARDSWLEILGRYLIGKRDDKKNLTGVIFPRYHQLDATRKLVANVLEQGAGQRYLIQHSAGSGKTNSIAWSAHFLADLHDVENKKLFDSVLVISDRNVLDAQLQEAIFDFERTTGVVETITSEHGSKSAQLGQALKNGKKIIVCTIQTFPFALQAVQELAATEGKCFAVIADEAHSSQTGDAAAKLKQLLSAEERAELEDGGEIDTETLLAAGMAARAGGNKGLTYVAFTATPKQKTAGAVWPARRGRPAAAVPCVLDASGDRRGFHPRRAEELHAVQAGFPSGARRQGVRRVAGGTQCGDEGNHAVGSPAPVQHRAEGADRGGALPRECAATARRQSQGHGGGRQPQGGGALAEGDPRLYRASALPAGRTGGVLG